MLKMFFTALISLFLLIPTTYASELPSCDELEKMVEVLDELADALEKEGRIAEGSSLDNELGNLVDALLDVAKIEENKNLTASVEMLDSAWEGNKWQQFRIALDAVMNTLDRIHHTECK